MAQVKTKLSIGSILRFFKFGDFLKAELPIHVFSVAFRTIWTKWRAGLPILRPILWLFNGRIQFPTCRRPEQVVPGLRRTDPESKEEIRFPMEQIRSVAQGPIRVFRILR